MGSHVPQSSVFPRDGAMAAAGDCSCDLSSSHGQGGSQPDGQALSPAFSWECGATADLCKWRSQDQCKWPAAAQWHMTMVIVLPELLNFLF